MAVVRFWQEMDLIWIDESHKTDHLNKTIDKTNFKTSKSKNINSTWFSWICVNVKELWILFMMHEKVKYFHVTEFCAKDRIGTLNVGNFFFNISTYIWQFWMHNKCTILK